MNENTTPTELQPSLIDGLQLALSVFNEGRAQSLKDEAEYQHTGVLLQSPSPYPPHDLRCALWIQGYNYSDVALGLDEAQSENKRLNTVVNDASKIMIKEAYGPQSAPAHLGINYKGLSRAQVADLEAQMGHCGITFLPLRQQTGDEVRQDYIPAGILQVIGNTKGLSRAYLALLKSTVGKTRTEIIDEFHKHLCEKAEIEAKNHELTKELNELRDAKGAPRLSDYYEQGFQSRLAGKPKKSRPATYSCDAKHWWRKGWEACDHRFLIPQLKQKIAELQDERIDLLDDIEDRDKALAPLNLHCHRVGGFSHKAARSWIEGAQQFIKHIPCQPHFTDEQQWQNLNVWLSQTLQQLNQQRIDEKHAREVKEVKVCAPHKHLSWHPSRIPADESLQNINEREIQAWVKFYTEVLGTTDAHKARQVFKHAVEALKEVPARDEESWIKNAVLFVESVWQNSPDSPQWVGYEMDYNWPEVWLRCRNREPKWFGDVFNINNSPEKENNTTNPTEAQ